MLLPHAFGAPAAAAGEGSDGAAGGELVRAFSCTTEVVFDELSAELIQSYIESGGCAASLHAGRAVGVRPLLLPRQP